MTLRMKKIICLAMVAVMAATCFTACGSKKGDTNTDTTLVDMTDEEISLTYMCWLSTAVADAMCDAFTEKYPNIQVNFIETTTGDVNSTIADMHGANNTPDAFWYLGEIDTPIMNSYYQDMTAYFENDPANTNLLKGIVEYKIGYFGTDYKWCTPVTFFPYVAWLNKQFFEDNSLTMPDADWTWEDMEQVMADATMSAAVGLYGNHRSFGMTCVGGAYPVTWYPFAADDDCIAEFGWDGSKYNMDAWAKGLNLQAEYLEKGWLIDESADTKGDYINSPDTLADLYDGNAVYAQDAGYVAIRTDTWYCWQIYWNNEDQGFLKNNVIWVPYIQPHTEATEGKTNICTFDMGGISQWSEHPREAYELLKWQCWDVDGWLKKAELYPTYSNDTYDNKTVRYNQQDLPITLDDKVWEAVRAFEWYPQAGDEYGREDYFDTVFEQFKQKYWTGLGSTIIPGFTTWLNTAYHGDVKVENQVLKKDGGIDATELVDELERTGLEYYEARMDEINQYIEWIGK